MIPPITREEKYMYEIVGAGKTAPEKPLTRKEIFYAVILGEDRTIPRPITNAEKYLATLAGAYSEALPFPTTRIEKFLAKAAGMDVETPVPVTREEIFWDNYSAVQKFEGVPPLTFKSNGKALKNYRIYGNTVNGESVGDLVQSGEHSGEYVVPVKIEGKNLVPSVTYWEDGYINYADGTVKQQSLSKEKISPFIKVNNDDILTFSYNVGTNAKWAAVAFYDDNKSFISRTQQITTIPISISINISNVSYIKITCNTFDIDIIPMLNSGSTALPYEPYHAPSTTNLYLPEQIKMVGDEAEYIDFGKQKQYFAGGTSADVILPALPTFSGTNTLTIGTAVQPSKVGIKGKVEGIVYGRAVFSQSLKTFTVYFYNGSTLLQTAENVQYGGTATYTGETPTKDGFTFSGWQPSNVNITADTSCYAQFVEG